LFAGQAGSEVNIPPLLRELISNLDIIVSSITGLCYATCWQERVSILHLTLRGLFPTQTDVGHVISIFHDLLSPMESQSSSSWLDSLRSIVDDWSLLKNHPMKSNISILVSACVLVGILGPGKFQFSIGDLKLFSGAISKTQVTALSVFDAVVETVVYFFEVGHAVLEQGSLRPLFFSTKGIDDLSREIATLKAFKNAAANGTIETLPGGFSVDEYRHRLNTALASMSDATFGLDKGSYERSLLIKKVEELERIRVDFESAHAATTQRLRPLAFCVHSTSACGKTTFVRESVALVLLANNFKSDDKHMITISDTDKYDSTMRSDVEAVIDDDVANQKAEYAPMSAAARIINFVNSKPYSANMAAVEDKGKVSCNIKVYAASTNVPTLEAYKTSNNPASVLCRFSYLVEIKVKPQFVRFVPGNDTSVQLDDKKVYAFMEANGFTEPCDRDVWDITVLTPFVVPGQRGQPDSVGYHVAEYEGKPMKDISYKTWLRFLGENSRQYFKGQKKIYMDSLNVAQSFKTCVHGSPMFLSCSECGDVRIPKGEKAPSFCETIDSVPIDSVVSSITEVPLDSQAGIMGATLGWFLRSWFNSGLKYAKDTFVGEFRMLETEATHVLYHYRKRWRDTIFHTWTDWIPDKCVDTYFGRYMIRRAVLCQNHRRVVWLRNLCLFLFCALVADCILNGFAWWDFALVLMLISTYKSIILGWDRRLEAELLSRRDDLGPMAKAVREKYAMKSLAFVGAIGLTYGGFLVLREALRAGRRIMGGRIYTPFGTTYDNHTPTTHKVVNSRGAPLFQFNWGHEEDTPTFVNQGNLQPTTKEEVASRASESNVWKVSAPISSFVNHKVATSTFGHISEKIMAQTVHFSVLEGDNWKVSNGIAIKSRVLLVPFHMLCEKTTEQGTHGKQLDSFKYRIIRYDTRHVGSEFHNTAYKKDIVHIAGTDFALVYLPSLGDKKDLTDLVVTTDYRGQVGLLYRDSHGIEHVYDAVTEFRSMVQHKDAPAFLGGRSFVQQGTFNGLCMGTYISKGKSPYVVGFHLGGRSGYPEGMFGCLYADQLKQALTTLHKQVDDTCSVQSGALPSTIMGGCVVTTPEIHPKCSTNFVEDLCHVDVLGSCVGKSTFRPKIQKSLISDAIKDEFGVDSIWGNPSTHPWKHERNFLLASGNAAKRMNPEALHWSAKDWSSGVIGWCHRTRTRFRKLTVIESVSGRDGDRWIDAMNKSTSVGFPLTGSKRNFLKKLDPLDWPEWSDPYTMGPELQEEYDRIIACYRKRERAYPVFKSCPKNEALKLSKDKKRLFQVAPTAFQVIVRQYFLELAKILSLCPLISECSVGINAMGDEWEQMISHLEQLPKQNCIAGDYKNWDQMLSPDVTRRAWLCLIDIAKEIGATNDDVAIMECIVSDMVNPVLAFDGTLIQLHAGNPSGQNLTAHINCVANSLLLRCVWFLGRDNPAPFRSCVHLQVYGDDNLATTSDPSFNMTQIGEILGSYGYVYTDAYKNATTVPFVNLDDAEYLKRHSVYHPALGRRLGALSKDSIFKCLHCYDADSKISKMEHADAVLQSASLEFFLLGEQEYESARSKLQNVASRVSLVSPVLLKDYNQRVDEWHATYSPKM
jgi:hypothetical protein